LLLEKETRCWRVATAPRAAVLVDAQAYYDAAMEAMTRARRSIHFLNWAFEPDTRMRPEPGRVGPGPGDIAHFLKGLAEAEPNLDVRILCWQSALPVAATQKFFPIVDRSVFAGSRVKFVLDGELPLGACHHQKIIVIDDAVAFCGGADIGQDRWDTSRHADDDPRREKSRSRYYPNRHEVMALADGPAAAALGELFRRRWRRCTGEALEPPPPAPTAAWPAGVEPMFAGARVGLSRTEPAWRGAPAVRENEALHLAAIAAARTCIYMENQYFTSELMARALARRLAEPDGPDVLLVSTTRSPSYFDQNTMDPTRSRFIEALKAADRFGRFQIYSPVTALGRDIIVHAKVTIIDDVLVRVGSANMNNRSFGFDTECDLSLEAEGSASEGHRAAIDRLRTDILAHWLGCPGAVVEDAVASAGGVCKALESLRQSGLRRLRPIAPRPLNPVAALIARYHIGDPVSPADSFKPWKRRRALERHCRTAAWND
jgi:phosphatidylserine/phosphatidylglycerophosphate/cardiolipin synthase-like enzyme